jgi:hypothetical protein
LEQANRKLNAKKSSQTIRSARIIIITIMQ